MRMCAYETRSLYDEDISRLLSSVISNRQRCLNIYKNDAAPCGRRILFSFLLQSYYYSLAALRSSIILMALSATGVPGPKTAATPASKRHW